MKVKSLHSFTDSLFVSFSSVRTAGMKSNSTLCHIHHYKSTMCAVSVDVVSDEDLYQLMFNTYHIKSYKDAAADL